MLCVVLQKQNETDFSVLIISAHVRKKGQDMIQ